MTDDTSRAAEQFEVEILGERRRAELAEHALHDPRGELMRAS